MLLNVVVECSIARYILNNIFLVLFPVVVIAVAVAFQKWFHAVQPSNACWKHLKETIHLVSPASIWRFCLSFTGINFISFHFTGQFYRIDCSRPVSSGRLFFNNWSELIRIWAEEKSLTRLNCGLRIRLIEFNVEHESIHKFAENP